MSVRSLPKPVDQVRTLQEAMACWKEDPMRIALTLAEGQPPMPQPWEPRLQLEGALLFVHPENEQREKALLEAGV